MEKQKLLTANILFCDIEAYYRALTFVMTVKKPVCKLQRK